MKIIKQTGFPHLFDSQGRWLTYHCPGFLRVVKFETGEVATVCNTCRQGYKFTFVLRGPL